MRDALIRFLDALEAIGADHEEVYDTDVRERLDEAARRGAVWDPDATSTSGATVDEFLGWVD